MHVCLAACTPMKKATVSRIVLYAGACVLVVIALFDVSFNPKFELPADRRALDTAQEALFAACFARRDMVIHQRAFSTIDNPDVQREFISTERDTARSACRAAFPMMYRMERTPFRFDLVDLRFRY